MYINFIRAAVLFFWLSFSYAVQADEKIDLVGIWSVKEMSQTLDGERYKYSQNFEFENNAEVVTLGTSYRYTFDGIKIVISSPIPATYKILEFDGKNSVWESYAGKSKTGYFFIEKQ